MAFPGVVIGADLIGRLDNPPPASCAECAVFGSRDNLTVHLFAASLAASQRRNGRDAGRGDQHLAGSPAAESRPWRNASV